MREMQEGVARALGPGPRRAPTPPTNGGRRPHGAVSLILGILVAGTVVACSAGTPPPPTETEAAEAEATRSSLAESPPADLDPIYEPWASVLTTHVDREGLVDYAALTENRGELETFMRILAGTDPATFATDEERIAFWINAYNATVLWQVTEYYPLDSVRDVGALRGLLAGFFKQPNTIAGEERTLDDIEHGILRARYPDPEIHWTLVCAAFGCPRLIRRPYVAADLEPLLQELAHEFLAQPRALRIDREAGVLYLSSYFDWYGEDFEAEAGDVVDYVLQFAPDGAAAWIRDHRETLSVEFMEYDWTLNDQAKGPRSTRREAGG